MIGLPVGCAAIALVERREIEALSDARAKVLLREVLAEQALQDESVRFSEGQRKQTYVDRRGELATGADAASPPPLR